MSAVRSTRHGGSIGIISIGAKDAAKAIGLPLRTLQQMTKDGHVPAARRKGRRYIYVVDELRAWVVDAPAVKAA